MFVKHLWIYWTANILLRIYKYEQILKMRSKPFTHRRVYFEILNGWKRLKSTCSREARQMTMLPTYLWHIRRWKWEGERDGRSQTPEHYSLNVGSLPLSCLIGPGANTGTSQTPWTEYSHYCHRVCVVSVISLLCWWFIIK